MKLYIDTETFSPSNLMTAGLARYCLQVEVMIVTWAVDDGPVQTWDVTRSPQPPVALLQAARECDRVVAHNAQFDTAVLRASQPEVAALLEGKWYCTMAQALRHGLPGGLDKLSKVFRLHEDDAKIKGRDMINLFCKLNKQGERNTSTTHPAEWRDFLTYAKQDIVAMRSIHKRMPTWNDSRFELSLWELDQRVNTRGIAVDAIFAKAAVRATKAEQDRLAKRTQELTDATVLRATQRDRLLAYMFVEHGVTLPDLRADTIERRLEDPELPEVLKELLRLRQTASKSSTSKYKRLLDMHVEGRLYYLLQYCGALRTGRWGGRNFQPQNLPRPKLDYPDVLMAIDAALSGAEDMLLDNVMEAMSSALRSALVAAPGRKLVVSDLSNIEGRMLAWIAGEEWKLEAFRAFDAKTGPDLYKLAYARSFAIDPEDVDKAMRQIGKVMELALGYQGGVGAFVAMAAAYGIDLDELAAAARPTIPRRVLLDSEETWQWALRKKRTLGLSQEVYVVCEALKRLWRAAHSATEALWGATETAARHAILNPGKAFAAGKLVFDRKGAWLRMKLPSGRFLLYPNPKLEGPLQQIQFAAWNVYKKAWCHEHTYGGKLVENACQASSRDVMAYAMPRAEAAGYPIVLTVHDELVTEPLDSDEFNVEGLSALLAHGDEWTAGLPLAASGFESMRYRKE